MDIFHFRTHECGEPHSKLFLVEPKIFADSWYKTILTLDYWIHFVGLVRDLGMIRLTCTKCHPVVSDRNGSKCQGAASVTDWSHCLQSRLDIYIYIVIIYIYGSIWKWDIPPMVAIHWMGHMMVNRYGFRTTPYQTKPYLYNRLIDYNKFYRYGYYNRCVIVININIISMNIIPKMVTKKDPLRPGHVVVPCPKIGRLLGTLLPLWERRQWVQINLRVLDTGFSIKRLARE